MQKLIVSSSTSSKDGCQHGELGIKDVNHVYGSTQRATLPLAFSGHKTKAKPASSRHTVCVLLLETIEALNRETDEEVQLQISRLLRLCIKLQQLKKPRKELSVSEESYVACGFS